MRAPPKCDVACLKDSVCAFPTNCLQSLDSRLCAHAQVTTDKVCSWWHHLSPIAACVPSRVLPSRETRTHAPCARACTNVDTCTAPRVYTPYGTASGPTFYPTARASLPSRQCARSTWMQSHHTMRHASSFIYMGTRIPIVGRSSAETEPLPPGTNQELHINVVRDARVRTRTQMRTTMDVAHMRPRP